MTRNIINRFREEFEYWLDGGSILYTSNNHDYCKIGGDHEWKSTGVYIKNDNCVEFRKAMLQGKTVQYDVSFTPATVCIDSTGAANWRDLKRHNFILHPNAYRIKPEDRQFKVGDWIKAKVTGTIKQMPETWRHCKTIGNDWVLWEPKYDEMCVFWNKKENRYIINRYKNTDGRYYVNMDGVYFDNIAPVTFELPAGGC